MAEKYAPSYRQGSLFRPVKREQDGVPETSYRALCPLAALSAVLGLLSILTFVGWTIALVPVAGLATGWLALRRIERTPEELTGSPLAVSGIALSLVFWGAGYSWLVYDGFYRLPPGYQRIDYPQLQPNPNDPEQIVSDEAKMLADRMVLIRGFMYPGRQTAGIREFVLVNDPGNCQYCNPQPKPTELIRVKMIGGLQVNFTTRPIEVGGKLIVHPDPTQMTAGAMLYEIEADYLR